MKKVSLLRPVRRVVGRVQVDRDPPRPTLPALPVALDDALGQLPSHPVQGAPTRAVLEARQRRLRRQTLAGHRVPPQQQLVDGILGQMVGIVPVRMAARDAEHPLADQVFERVPDLLRRALVGQTPGEALDEVVYPLGRLEEHGATVGAGLLPVEGGHDRLAAEFREQNTLWYRGVRHAGASVVPKTPVVSSVLAHGGSCFLTEIPTLPNNPG